MVQFRQENGVGYVILRFLFAPKCFVAHIARRLYLWEDCVGRSQQKSECEQTKGSDGGWKVPINRQVAAGDSSQVPAAAAGATFVPVFRPVYNPF